MRYYAMLATVIAVSTVVCFTISDICQSDNRRREVIACIDAPNQSCKP